MPKCPPDVLVILLGFMTVTGAVCHGNGDATPAACEAVAGTDAGWVPSEASFALPGQEDWTDHGLILTHGEEGAWDHHLYGGFAGAAVKKDTTFFLYYQGARAYSEPYETVTYRAVGVATSNDGIHFVKHPSNPVITWFPHESLEEGAASAAATVDGNGEVVIFYGANTAVNEQLVNADGRVAIAPDGVTFRDGGIVLNHANRNTWGHGDELFPIIGLQDGGTWYVYYIPNGTPQRGLVGVAWGPDRQQLRSSAAASAAGEKVLAWGMGGYARLGARTYALFFNDARTSCMEVRTVHLDAPAQLSPPVRRYRFEDFTQGTILLDEAAETWYLFYRTQDQEGYHVKSAPAVRYP